MPVPQTDGITDSFLAHLSLEADCTGMRMTKTTTPWDLLNRRGQLEGSPQPLRRKMTQKGKSKATLPDIQTNEDDTSNKKLTKKDYKRPDIIEAKQTELEKFNVVETVPNAPWGAEICTQTGW